MSDSAASAIERPHILIVSADEGLVEFLSTGLVVGGFWLSTVASGIQSLEVFRLRSFDLVLIDAALSGLSALDVVRRLRGKTGAAAAEIPRTDVPILMIAATDEEASVAEVSAAGADGRLLAPLDIEELVPRLHDVIKRWRADHPGRPYADEAAQRGTDTGT